MQNFSELGLSPALLRAIGDLGFENPTPIQEKAIPAILSESQDIIALAQTGTGKTAAFGLPIIEQIDAQNDNVQAIILCPTRELGVQIAKDLESFAKYIAPLKITAVYGGADITKQIKALKSGTHIVVGTPGRVIDLLKRGVLKINNIQWLVLDEADEMLNMGFKDDIDTILAATPAERQTLLFSATLPQEIMRIAEEYMHQPLEISVGKRNEGAANVEHEYYMVHAKDRYEALKRIADINPKIYGIVFCRTRQETKDIAEKLIQDGYNADALHGDLSQAQRDYVMNRFRTRLLQILVATDVAARGLDVNDLTHVINYNLPDELEVYIHRSGRTGRAGKSGTSIAIIHMRELHKIQRLEKLLRKNFSRERVPTGKEICEKQLFNLVDKVENIEVNQTQIEQFLPAIYKKLSWLSREELIQHFVSVEFNRFLDYYKNATDLNVNTDRKSSRFEEDRFENKSGKKDIQRERGRRGKMAYTRFYINVGHKNNLSVPKLIGLINDRTQNRDINIGKIDIMKKFAFFEIDSRYESEVNRAFKNARFEGVDLMVEISKPEPTTPSYAKTKKMVEGNFDDFEWDKYSSSDNKKKRSKKKKR
ncbi:MAG: DEAD/DEAH box helicase [Chitinophagales bacterium]|nr:DEAD/DEAH box helicase [Bacteroidota bacterium]MCB9043680.1 DEAD/DEAH box helicase [Chitinophagales bacterium]